MNAEQRSSLEKRYQEYQRRIGLLQEQKARKGIDTEPHILVEIEDIEREMSMIQQVLAKPSTRPARKVAFVSDFDNPDQTWDTGIDQFKQGSVEMRITDGKWVWSINTTADCTYRQNAGASHLAEFDVEAEFNLLHTTNTIAYGIYFDDSYGRYMFFISSNHSFSFQFKDHQTNTWKDLSIWSRSQAIKRRSPNTLRIVVSNNRMELYINGMYMTSHPDSDPENRISGVMVMTDRGNTEAVVEILRFSLRSPEESP